jgi:hypothetical protein
VIDTDADIQQWVGRRVRVRYSGECPYCDERDPDYWLDGRVGRVESIIPLTLRRHYYEVRFDDGTVLENVPVPTFGITVTLDKPNFAEGELEVLQ